MVREGGGAGTTQAVDVLSIIWVSCTRMAMAWIRAIPWRCGGMQRPPLRATSKRKLESPQSSQRPRFIVRTAAESSNLVESESRSRRRRERRERRRLIRLMLMAVKRRRIAAHCLTGQTEPTE